MENLLKLTKKKLEELGREKGIELDRRKSKATLVEELEDYLCKCGKTEDENAFCDGSHAKTLVDLKSEEVESTSTYLTAKPESYKFVGATGSCKCKDEKGVKVLKFANTKQVQTFAINQKAQVVAQEDYFILVR